MLEQPSLLLRPWIHGLEGSWPRSQLHGLGWVRAIVNPASESLLGFAAWNASMFPGWLGWLGRKRIAVFEGEDQSLLMTLYRAWHSPRTWDLFDADERRVARLAREAIYDSLGSKLAALCLSVDGSDSLLRGEDGSVLASWQDSAGHGCYFRFGETGFTSPFTRMAALAGVLALPPWPGDVALAARPAV
jgi:hypothetical protein